MPGNRQVALGSQVGAVRADSVETLGSPPLLLPVFLAGCSARVSCQKGRSERWRGAAHLPLLLVLRLGGWWKRSTP